MQQQQQKMQLQVERALPTAVSVMKALLFSPNEPVSNVDVIRAWEADFSLHSHAALLAESIAQDTLQITAPLAEPSHEPHPQSAQMLDFRFELLQSLRNMQEKIQSGLKARVTSMSFQPRLYRLADRLGFSSAELRAFVFIILTCCGLDGPPADERRQAHRPRSEMLTCRQFAEMDGYQLLHFLSPSRKHFVQGLLEVEEEFATIYTENRFRAPREVLKAVYGCTLTLDEAMTLGTSVLAEVLAEESGSVLHADSTASSPRKSPSTALADAPDSQLLDQLSSARERTTDASAMLELLSELRQDDEERLSRDPSSDSAVPGESVNHTDQPTDESETTQNARPRTESDGDTEPDAALETEVDVDPFKDDLDYLKDGFEVVQEACKVYNFREKNSEEDRYSSTKRPVEALQREADAKLRKAAARFSRRLNRTKQRGAFLPRLEQLVDKLRLDHFERMVILTLVGAVLSQSIRKTLRSDPSLTYESSITVAKLLRVHCDGDLRQEITSRSFFYRNATLVRSGIVTIDVPYNMPYSDLGDFCCELDHMVLDFVAGLHTELEEIMDSARCYSPKVNMDQVVLPQEMKDLVVQRAENFEVFRRLRREVGFDDIVRYGRGLTLFFHGKSGTGKTLFANALAAHLKKKLLVVDFSSLNSSKHSNSDAYRIVFREAKIHGAIVFIDECDELFESRERGGKGAVTVALREMETFDGIMILATNRPQMLDEAMHRRIALSLMFEAPDAKLRLAIWQNHVPKKLRLADDVDLKALAIEFELTGGYIKNAVFQALAQAVNCAQKQRRDESANGGASVKPLSPLGPEDVVVTMAQLRSACRLQARGDLKRTKLERRVIPKAGLDSLVVSDEAMKTLRNIVSVEKVRGVMATRMGFKDRQSRCNCVLIFGPSGCGKSFAASCLGFETGRPLQRLAASELHGSREGTSQIGDVFSQAAVAGAVVVVEHAEQLLYEAANPTSTASPGLELLFHMQSFDGLVVLCCATAETPTQAGWPGQLSIPNRVSTLLSYIVVLKMPKKDARLRLWQNLIPRDTPVHPEVTENLDQIATDFEFSGAKIASCIRRAAAGAAMRRNRVALLEPGEKETEEVVRLSDIQAACKAEVDLKQDAEGDSEWVDRLFV